MLAKTIFRLISLFFNNSIGQKFLELVAKANLALLGIGNGAGVDNSGEFSVVRNVFQQPKNDKYIIFDVGANQGQFRSMTANILKEKLTDDDFLTYSFEPSKSTFEILVKNCPPSNAPYLHNFGLGNVEKKSKLYYDQIGSGLASQSKRDLSFINIELGIEEEIEIRTLDSFCMENRIAKIDLLKIDVEGYEMEVLQGSTDMISSGKVRSIMFEFGGSNIDTRTYFKDFYNYFTSNDFKIHRITPGGYLFPLESYKEIYEQFRTTNFLAIRK